jgi:predicted transcriptional regulator
MKVSTIRLDDEDFAALQRISEAEDRSLGYLMRRAVKLFLKAKAQGLDKTTTSE